MKIIKISVALVATIWYTIPIDIETLTSTEEIVMHDETETVQILPLEVVFAEARAIAELLFNSAGRDDAERDY